MLQRDRQSKSLMITLILMSPMAAVADTVIGHSPDNTTGHMLGGWTSFLLGGAAGGPAGAVVAGLAGAWAGGKVQELSGHSDTLHHVETANGEVVLRSPKRVFAKGEQVDIVGGRLRPREQ